MVDCYHKECDNWTQDLGTDERYEFLTSTAQSLILSVVEMTVEEPKFDCFLETIQYLTIKATMTSTSSTTTTTTTTTSTTSTTTTTTAASTTTTTSTTTQSPEELYEADEEDFDESINEVGTDLFNGDVLQELIKLELSKILKNFQMPSPIASEPKHIPIPPQQAPLLRGQDFAASPAASNPASGMMTNTIGTQINIQNMNVDMKKMSRETEHELDAEKCLVRSNQGLLLGSGQHDITEEALTNVVRNFYFGGTSDRRKYASKSKNSPMVIKLVDDKLS